MHVKYVVVFCSAFLIIAVIAFFALRYGRAFLFAASKKKVSRDVRALTGLDEVLAHQTAYTRLCLLLRIVPPASYHTRFVLRLVRLYYRSLQLFDALCRLAGPCLNKWFRRERLACLHFTALLLEDRIESNREFCRKHLNNGFHT